MRRDTLIDFFADLTAIRADFLVFDDGYRRRTHTYADVGRAARGFAARLAAAGLRQGDKVVFWGENRPEWIACYWGCLLAGVIVVPIDYRSSAAFVDKVRRLVESRVVLIGEEVRLDASLAAASGGTPATEQAPGGYEVWHFADLDWRADGPMPAVAHSRDDVIQIIFTSGATAEPKGVVIRHRNVMANTVPVERGVMEYRRYIRLFHPIRLVNLLPLSHMFGQSMATNIPPMIRGTVIFTRSLNPHDIIRLVRTRRVSVLVCVPKILDVLREHVLRAFPESAEPPPTGISIPGRWWRYRRVHSMLGLKFWAFVVGAAPLPPDLEEFWRRMGFAVIQGYGLTETAPIVTLNHPFRTSRGSVGTAIGGVEIRIADDGEILVRGENVTSGYFVSSTGEAQAPVDSPIDRDGWLHTGDIGERDEAGRVFIKGRKKEMIVTPEGLNVFPEDVERVLNSIERVRDSAVVGVAEGAEERVHAVLVLDPGADSNAIVRAANAQLADHQRIRTASVWPDGDLPRTEGTRKLKRGQIREWVASGRPPAAARQDDSLEALVGRFARGRDVSGATTLEELGLSSLERVELMVALEDRFQTRIDEGRFSEVASIGELRTLVEAPVATEAVEEPVDFPTWNRSRPVALVRRLSLAIWILPIARIFAHLRVEGLAHLRNLEGPVVFASNHQSHMDVPVILAALPGRWRSRAAPAMQKEFFKAHFFPREYPWRKRFKESLLYYLAAFYFNAFPLPQREAGARQTLQYIGELTGEGWSIVIFPEGLRSETGNIRPFRGGIGMIGSRLEVPIVPVRIDGADRVLHQTWRMARPGRVGVAFGEPLRLRGDDYAALAAKVEAAVRAL
ncbi:MAG TPA: AMP-binding protein [Vicinamibacterales bacterium]|nr:AMP-binding protein [Vicinamibacterales bacterium]